MYVLLAERSSLPIFIDRSYPHSVKRTRTRRAAGRSSASTKTARITVVITLRRDGTRQEVSATEKLLS